MKQIYLLLSGVLLSSAISAQDTASVEGPWKYNGMASLNFAQVSLTNWAQGGESSYAINGLSAINFNYNKNNNSWANSLDMGYGIQKVGEESPTKTDDHLELISKYGRKTKSNWYYSGMLNFKTQFTEGYKKTETEKIVISDFLSPGYIMLSIGMEYKKNDSFFFSVSPLTGKITIITDDSLSTAGSFGVDPGENMRAEFGGSVKVGLNREIMENVNLSSTLDLFSNYIEKPQNIDISWKAMLNMKINKFLSANISTHIIYDDDVAYTDDNGISQGPRVQFKEMLGIGLSYKF